MTQPSNQAPDIPAPSDTQVSTVVLDGGHRLAYTEYGDPDGAPVVFLHGTPGSRRLGALLDAAARTHGVRLLALDRPGYGQSDPWPTRDVDDAGRFVTGVVDDVGAETAGLVAFSGGSPHALAAAAAHPDRVTRVDVVGGATPPDVTEALPTVQRLLVGLATATPTLLRGLLRGQAALATRLDPSFVVAQYTAGSDDGIPDAVAEVVKADFLEAFAHTRRGAVQEIRLTAMDWGVDFDEIDADVCLWHGDADTNVPISDARRLSELIPGVELRVLEGVDHLRSLLRSADDVLARHA